MQAMEGGADRRSHSQPPLGAPLPTFGAQPAVVEYVFKVRWWKKFVIAVLDHDAQLAKMEGRVARRPLPLPDLLEWRCSSWRSSFEVQEAVRTLALAVTRARQIHGDNLDALQVQVHRNNTNVIQTIGNVHLDQLQLMERVRGVAENLEMEQGVLHSLQTAHQALVERLENREKTIADLTTRIAEIESVNRQQQIELTQRYEENVENT